MNSTLRGQLFIRKAITRGITDDMKNWIELGVLTTNEDAANG